MAIHSPYTEITGPYFSVYSEARLSGSEFPLHDGETTDTSFSEHLFVIFFLTFR